MVDGFHYKGQLMAKREEGTSGPADELIARFQLETEAKLAELAAAQQRAMVQHEHKIAAMTDQWNQLSASVAGLQRAVDDGLHHMRKGVEEVNTALREACKQAAKAADAAAVFDKLKSSQPDFHAMVKALELKVAKVQDANTNTLAQLTAASQRLDAFEVMVPEVDEVKATVRGLDRITADLNSDYQKRRRGAAQ